MDLSQAEETLINALSFVPTEDKITEMIQKFDEVKENVDLKNPKSLNQLPNNLLSKAPGIKTTNIRTSVLFTLAHEGRFKVPQKMIESKIPNSIDDLAGFNYLEAEDFLKTTEGSTKPGFDIEVDEDIPKLNFKNSDFAILADGPKKPFISYPTGPSNGPNGVFINVDNKYKINGFPRYNLFFATNPYEIKILLDAYLTFRDQHLAAIFNIYCNSLPTDTEGEVNYKIIQNAFMTIRDKIFEELKINNTNIFDIYEKFKYKLKQDYGIKCISFCQTWTRKKGELETQFSEHIPHFQTKFYICNDEKFLEHILVTREEFKTNYIKALEQWTTLFRDYTHTKDGTPNPAFVHLDETKKQLDKSLPPFKVPDDYEEMHLTYEHLLQKLEDLGGVPESIFVRGKDANKNSIFIVNPGQEPQSIGSVAVAGGSRTLSKRRPSSNIAQIINSLKSTKVSSTQKYPKSHKVFKKKTGRKLSHRKKIRY